MAQLSDLVKPWADGDIPHGESIDLNEYPVALLKMTRCRSFRADLLHKLTIIVRAQGGMNRAAERLRINRHTFRHWLRYDATPRSKLLFERIDNAYAEALEKLAAAASKKSRPKAAQ